MSRFGLWLLILGSLCAAACTVGEGEGHVTAKPKLFIEDCWDGPFDLNPDFFGAVPFGDNLLIRVQRGDNIQELSDGLTIAVTDISRVREKLGQPLAVGLPRGVSPPGVPLKEQPNPPQVTLSLYLHNSCHAQNSAIYSVSGSIVFHSLFNGVINESRAEARLTDAEFTAEFADPRLLEGPEAMLKPETVSAIEGSFRFYFQRGQPAQPFQ